jgi:spore coat polysaccharide biosynthesis predicted glycosyltransferase SpsG
VKFLFRADASPSQGTGHVMRSLTLAVELLERNHEVAFVTGPVEIDWLRDTIRESGVTVSQCEYDSLSAEVVRDFGAERVVVDSYRIPAQLISNLDRHVPVLAIVDGDDRGIVASLYLDQNLGAENIDRPDLTGERFLAGSRYALVRRAVLQATRAEPWRIEADPPRVLCFLGGTDATGSVVEVVRAIAALERSLELTVVAAPVHHPAIRAVVGDTTLLELVPPTPDLPRLFAQTDIVVSAAGTSAWDICTLGLPAVLVGVVDNQSASLREAVARGLVLGVDTTDPGSIGLAQVGVDVARLLDDETLREGLSARSRAEFDGRGASRVAERLELDHIGALLEW